VNLEQVLIPTRVATAGMTVREVFEECSRANSPGLPFSDDNGRITGRITLKNILKSVCLPDYLVELVRVLGEQPSSLQDMEDQVKQILNNPVDPYIQEPHLSITSGSSVVKAMALMEQSDTSYIFVVDEERYLGVVTIHNLASKLVHLDKPS
jgi:CBS domain-containing protein